ncbi:CBS domain-containing protein [Geomonas terrae]|uniref:CBS domain-containing protein n=1 Tax=Geomonas terrae TaxID=2562681 RepID=A0A4S1CB98_9BACT|nr:nucleotidyltransferase family protein [Geomonas terrae]TGU70601.1 CBS domain-containing protein [Geomonas terrae]
MDNWKKVVVSLDTTIKSTIEIIDATAMQIALVVDEGMRLVGTITDGDVRRAILHNISLDGPASTIMNPHPIVATTTQSRETTLTVMRNKVIRQIPVVQEDGVLVGLEIFDELVKPVARKNVVLLMAGGLGSRLRPLTNECPKPLLKIGDKPILETILENFIEHGFRKFYLSVNYMAEMIEEYFGDGSNWGVEISYLRENERMGTAGALSLLPPGIEDPVIVMNGDLLTRVNFTHLLNFHLENPGKATICVRDYEFRVPYGVVKVDGHRLTGIAEKPVHQFFVCAGIYVLDSDVIGMVPKSTFYDMPHLLEKLLAEKHDTSVFPVREYWMDIGRLADFERANSDYVEVFRKI